MTSGVSVISLIGKSCTRLESRRRALRVGIEGPDRFQRIAEEIESDRIAAGRIEIEDAAAHGILPGIGDGAGAHIAGNLQALDQRLHGQHVARLKFKARGGDEVARRDFLQQRIDGRQHDQRLDIACRAAGERGKRGDAPRDRLAVGSDAVVRHAVPGRKDQTPVRRGRRSAAPLPAWQACWRRARHAGSAWPARVARQSRRAEARRALRARRRRSRARSRANDRQARREALQVTSIETSSRVSHVGSRPWKRLSRVDQFVEVGLAERIAFQHAALDRRVGRLDQPLERGNLGSVHSVEGMFGVAAEQEVHLL